tara:strand:+ start:378 stop:791 length:414 start_codon:yes stop_codon:yes gene_type:complete
MISLIRKMDLITSLDDLVRAQEHLLRVKTLLKNNRYENYLYDPIGHIESELDRQIQIAKRKEVQEFGEREPFTPVIQEKETPKDKEKLYNVLEISTNGMNPPDSSFTSLSRAEATQKYESLLNEGISPDDIKIVRVQ